MAEYQTDIPAQPLEAWHEDRGTALWWRFPISEPPYVGTPNDEDWEDDYYTHWTPIPLPANPDGEPRVRDNQALHTMLLVIDHWQCAVADISRLSDDEYWQVADWAIATIDRANDNDVAVPPKPAWLKNLPEPVNQWQTKNP